MTRTDMQFTASSSGRLSSSAFAQLDEGDAADGLTAPRD